MAQACAMVARDRFHQFAGQAVLTLNQLALLRYSQPMCKPLDAAVRPARVVAQWVPDVHVGCRQ